MKKLKRREKTILRLMMAVVGIAVFTEIWDRYAQARDETESRILTLQDQIDSMAKALEEEDINAYLEESEEIQEELEDASGLILELPDETNASLLFRERISMMAEAAGLKVNSISGRKTKDLKKDSDMKILRVYFGWDGSLEELMTFFDSMEQEEYCVIIENVHISARRQPKRRTKRKNSNLQQRKRLNGNAVLTTIFRENKEATADRYTARKPVPRIRLDEEPEEDELGTPTKNSTDKTASGGKLKPSLPKTGEGGGGLAQPDRALTEAPKPTPRTQRPVLPKPQPLTQTSKPKKKP